MANSIHREAIELLLSAIYRQAGPDGRTSSFMYGRPGSPMWEHSLGTEVFYRRSKMIRAVLYVRQHGPPYLKYLSVRDIWSMLVRFVSENFWHIGIETFLKRFECSYADALSDTTKVLLADALASSAIFVPANSVTIFPLVPVRVAADFDSAPFFLLSPESLVSHLSQAEAERWIEPKWFPPLKEPQGRVELPSAWLGVRSPAVESSVKMKAAILGALALTPLPRDRHLFSGRRMFGGRCTLGDDGATTSFGDAHTPPMMEDIVVTEKDHEWLSLLATKVVSNEKAIRRQLRALEYFYRAWPLAQSERFPILCMVLDAVFGDANQATQAVIDGIRATIGEHINEPRLRVLMKLRASVIHGGAPDVYDSRSYARYYESYGEDPIFDLELLATRCLRKIVFDDTLAEHADPAAHLIAEMQAKGRLPQRLDISTILNEKTI